MYFLFQHEASCWSKHALLPSVKVSKSIPHRSAAAGAFVNIFKVKGNDTETQKNTSDKLIDLFDIEDFDFRTMTRSTNIWNSRRNVSFPDDSVIVDNLKYGKPTVLRNIFQSPCRSTMLKRSKTQVVPSLKPSSSSRNDTPSSSRCLRESQVKFKNFKEAYATHMDQKQTDEEI